MSEEPLDEPLAAIEQALAHFSLPPSSLDRDRLMYLAGQAAANRRHRSHRLWALSTVASWLVTLAVGSLWLVGSARPVEQMAQKPAIRPSLPVVAACPPTVPLRNDYLVLRQLLLTEGVEALPSPAAVHAPVPKPLRARDAYGGWGDGDRS